MSSIKKFLSSLHTRTVGIAGLIMFGPALALLAKMSFVVSLLQVYLPHLQAPQVNFLAALVVGVAGACLYLGKSVFADEGLPINPQM